MTLPRDLYLDLTRLSIDERVSAGFREACRVEPGDRVDEFVKIERAK